MSDKVLLVGGAGISKALMEVMLLADRGGMPVLLTPPTPRFEPIPFVPCEMEEMLMHMLMPNHPRRPSLPQLLSDIAALEIEALLLRRPRPFRPTGNKRSRRRRKG